MKNIKKVSVIGIGNLGKQIASWAASYNYQVDIYDNNCPAKCCYFISKV